MTILTNAHTHLELGWLAEICPDENGRDFIPWIQDLGQRRQKLTMMGCFSETTFRRAVDAGIEALVAAGTTHLTDISTTGSSIHPLLASGLQGVVYVEIIGQFAESADRAIAMARYLIDEARPKERSGMRIGLSLHSPYTVHPALWKKGLAYARDNDLPLCIHIAESPAEYDWLMTDTGPGADLRRETGVPLVSPRKSPIQYLEDLGALDLQPLLIHGVQVDEGDVQRIKTSGSRMVHCPRSNLRLRCGRMPLELYLKHEVPVYLGTDSLASSPSLDVRDEVEAAIALHHGYVEPDAIRALAAKPLIIDK
jgi:5-methylthioadenosine/S-adenosylhomocysteine deaminase